MNSLLFGILVICLLGSWITKIYSYDEDKLDKKKINELRSRIQRERVLTYAMREDSSKEFNIVMAAIADVVSRSTCINVIRINDTKTADLLGQPGNTKGWCGFYFRGMTESWVSFLCNEGSKKALRFFIRDHFRVNPAFLYPLYYDRSEIKLWFLEISDLNDKLGCPCEDQREDCAKHENACSTDGWMIGECIKYCGVCPYYDLHI